MDSSLSHCAQDVPAMLKRKWTPLKEGSEHEPFTGRSFTETREDSATPGTRPGSDTETSHKRPRLDASNPMGAEAVLGLPKEDVSRTSPYPLEVWQRICAFLDPASLGRLICVDRALNTLLDPRQPVPESLVRDRLTQNDIWAVSRKLLMGFPRPLSWISELDMWKLILGKSCQFCGRRSKQAVSTTSSPWCSGPGPEGVRVIWPFAVRSCGKCLASRMTKVGLSFQFTCGRS